MKKHLKNEKGFTIIEVMIVLVIAAVILLIVFLAVPALQRNSRNTQRKEDVSNALSAVNEFATNNNGQYPDSTSEVSAKTFTFKKSTGGVTSSAKLGFYEDGEVTATQVAGGGEAEDTLTIVTGAKCDATTAGKTVSQTRSVAAVYALEGGSNALAWTCQEL